MIKLFHYKIPFRSPFRTSMGEFRVREGIILDDGQNIRTEIAPLPGFSNETTGDIVDFLQKNSRLIKHYYEQASLDLFLTDEFTALAPPGMPSLRFGLSIMAAQQEAVIAGVPLYKWLAHRYSSPAAVNSHKISAPPKPNSSTRSDPPDHTRQPTPLVRSNAVVGLHETTSLLHYIAHHERSGFTTVKVKLPPDWQKAFSLITTVCRKFPQIFFRFDANGAFSESNAHRLFRQLEQECQASGSIGNIDYLEEPLNKPDMKALSRLRQYNIRIAADESVRTPEHLQEMLTHHAADVLVLKPMLFGAMSEMSTIWPAAVNQIGVTVSSSLESVVGRMLLAHLSAFVNTLNPAEHGLATGDLFSGDLPYNIRNGQPGPEHVLSEDKGIGLQPDFPLSDCHQGKLSGSDSWISGGVEMKIIPF